MEKSISLTQVEHSLSSKEPEAFFDLASIEQMHLKQANDSSLSFQPAFVPNLTNYPDEFQSKPQRDDSKASGEFLHEKAQDLGSLEKEMNSSNQVENYLDESDDEEESGKESSTRAQPNPSRNLEENKGPVKPKEKPNFMERKMKEENKQQAIREELIKEAIREELFGVRETVEKKLSEQLKEAGLKIDESLNKVHQNANLVIGERLDQTIPVEFERQFQQTVKPMIEKYMSAFNEQALALFEKGEKQIREKVLFESQRASNLENQIEGGLRSVMEVQRSFQDVIAMNKLVVEKKESSERELRETLETVNSRLSDVLLRQEQIIGRAKPKGSSGPTAPILGSSHGFMPFGPLLNQNAQVLGQTAPGLGNLSS